MIKPPSLVADYTLIYSGDPALKLPEDPDERAKALEVAWETGRWDDLILAGETPTLFEVRHLTASALQWWRGEIENSSIYKRRLSPEELSSLVLRLAMRRVVNLGDYKIKHERIGTITLATSELIDAIGASAREEAMNVIAELAHIVVRRSEASPSPK